MHRNSFLCKSFLHCFYSLFFLRLVTRDWSPLSPHPTFFVFHPPYIWLSVFICSSLVIAFSFYLFPSSRSHFFSIPLFSSVFFLLFSFLFPFLSLKYPSLAIQLSLIVILSLPSFPAQTNHLPSMFCLSHSFYFYYSVSLRLPTLFIALILSMQSITFSFITLFSFLSFSFLLFLSNLPSLFN